MIEVGSYCCSSVESPLPSSKTMSSCLAAPFRFFGFGIGVMNSARRRRSMIRCVGWPCVVQLPVPRAGTRRASSGSGGRRMSFPRPPLFSMPAIAEPASRASLARGVTLRQPLDVHPSLVRTNPSADFFYDQRGSGCSISSLRTTACFWSITVLSTPLARLPRHAMDRHPERQRHALQQPSFEPHRRIEQRVATSGGRLGGLEVATARHQLQAARGPYRGEEQRVRA